MPAILTHDFFGKDMLEANPNLIGTNAEERHAFLLGNQGPDPLFYLVASPSARAFFKLGGTMHHESPSALLANLKESLCVLSDDELAVGRAYARGFLCHYALDRAMHPLVYCQQFAICDAGIEGLTRDQGNEVHAEIEREFDEMVLFTKLGRTIRDYKPYTQALRATDATLATIGKMYAYAVMKTYKRFPGPELFGTAVRNFRTVQRLFYSPGGSKQNAVNTVETRMLRRSFSFYKSMSHRDNPTRVSDFDNRYRKPWENPFTHATSTDSFWDIFGAAQLAAASIIAVFGEDGFDASIAAQVTGGLDFSGEPVE